MMSGIKIPLNKSMSLESNIIEITKPDVVFIPLINQTNFDCDCLVEVNDKIFKGSIIGKRTDIDFPIHSSISGKVITIAEKLYLNGKYVRCVGIKNDFKEKQVELKGIKEKITSYSKEEFIKLLKQCAVTGMSSSDFPTFFKYKKNIHTLIVNAVECEPYITADTMLSKIKAEEILEGIDAIMEINNLKKAVIVIKENNTTMRSNLEDFIGTYPNITLETIKNLYPGGWERNIIKQVLNLEYNELPLEKGIVVNNFTTIYAIYKALKYRRPISQRIITISGDMINKPQNVLVKIGTPVKDIINKIGGYKKGVEVKLIAGGPMMGMALPSDDLVVTKNLTGIVILSNEFKYNSITCLRCGKCINICPSKLLPILIREKLNDYHGLKSLKPEKCIECGLCSYICPSKIDIRKDILEAKKEVRGN